MPTLAELRRRFSTLTVSERQPLPGRGRQTAPYASDTSIAADEVLISDVRSGLTPVQVVDGKFGVALHREESRQDQDLVLRPHIGNPR